MQTDTAVEIRTSLKVLLEAAGFASTHYDGDEGEYLNKNMLAGAMPYFSEHAVDHDLIELETEIVIEVLPDETVQLVAQGPDYFEEPVPVWSDEGLALLVDAGLDRAALVAAQVKN